MKKSSPIQICFILAWAFCAAKIHGQSEPAPANEASAPSADAQGGSDSKGTAQTETNPSQDQPQYVPALNGAGLFSLDKIQSLRVLAGGAVSTGFDTNPNTSTESEASAMYSFAPYIGIAAGNARTQFLFQYRPIFTQYSAYTGNSLQQASATLTNRPSPRWTWTIGINTLHGDDSVRPLASTHSVVVGSVAGSGSSSASYLPNAGVVTDINGGFELLYNVSPRDVLRMQIANSFNSYSQLHEAGAVVTETVNYSHAVGPTLGVLAYEQTSQYYLDLHCATIGGGFGLTWQPRADAKLSVQGGPQFNSPGCNQQQGFSYHVSFSSNISGKSQFYFRGDRQPVNGFLGPGLWQNNVSGGYQRKFSMRDLVGVDLVYVQSSTLANSEDYKGFFAETSYTRQISRALGLSCRYQNFMGRQGTLRSTRNMLLLSIVLTPKSPSLSD